MAKKCPPGVFCVENYTLGILILIIIGFLLYLWNTGKNGSGSGGGSGNSNNSDNLLSTLSSRVDNLVSNMNMNIMIRFSKIKGAIPNSSWIDSSKLDSYTLPTFTKKIFSYLGKK